jgi:hypothetical protein
MKYLDIAFIETGETNSVYPNEDFYDYVVVEATKDGLNWLPLADGYDFNYSDKWSGGGNTYESTPTQDLYVEHTIQLDQVFAANDTIMIRFNLHSDPFTSGWGWAIDNIRIQEEESGIFDKDVSDFEIVLFPNPTESDFAIELKDVYIGIVEVCIYSIDGQVIYKNSYFKDSEYFHKKIDAHLSVSGNYIVKVKIGERHSSEIIVVK